MFTITLHYLVSIQHIFSICLLLIDIAYTTFFLLGLLMSMQVPFVGFQPLRTSEHMAAAGIVVVYLFHYTKCCTVELHVVGTVWLN